MADDVLAQDFSCEPYWTHGLPAFTAGGTVASDLDVAVVGGGYAGLSAALSLARGGARVAVFEAGMIGEGASSRSAGSLSHVPKAGLADLQARYGAAVARRVYGEARQAREFVEDLIRTQQIACSLRRSSRFIAAHSPRAFAKQQKLLPGLREGWGEVALVARDQQRREIGSDAFFGGIRLATAATLQPALLQHGLARAAVQAGAGIRQRDAVTDIRRDGAGFAVTTQAGGCSARAVVIATNAETGRHIPAFRALRRRMAVMPAYALATEAIGEARVAKILPSLGPVSDTCKILHYMAPNEDRTRLIMSARAGQSDGGLHEKARRIFGFFAARFPELRGVRVTHCWSGRFALTGDWVPHIGVQDGLHYVLGCCGTGIPMATYLGHKVAQRILGAAGAETVFDRPLPGMPAWKRSALLLPLAVRGYALRDRLFR